MISTCKGDSNSASVSRSLDHIVFVTVPQGDITELFGQGMCLFDLHVADLDRRTLPDADMEKQQIGLGGYCLADPIHMDLLALLKYHSNVKLGLITEIGRTGLAFRYLVHDTREGREPDWSSGEMRVTCKIKDQYIEKLPCKLVSDRDISAQYSFSLTPMRKCKVEFGQLTPEQVLQLDKFIEKCSERPSRESVQPAQ